MNTKEKILAVASELLSDNGFNAFSFQDISNVIGIKTSSIHYYFPTKADLIVGIINYSQRQQNDLFETIKRKSPNKKLSMLIDFYVDLAQKGKMCPIVSISSDMNNIDEQIKFELIKFYDFMVAWLAAVLEEGINTNHFVSNQSPTNKSTEILNILAMLPILSRLGKGPESFTRIKQSIKDDVVNKDYSIKEI
ncbi:TetR/AcrR family transcriptional regulator [Chryseobacterium tongliaoense]|uniref:TetR/AcrR family transcriptional regulator n=1 Tax=Chryseobacterium tongliaoense TaxID=3240933 RepID=UPI003510E3F1